MTIGDDGKARDTGTDDVELEEGSQEVKKKWVDPMGKSGTVLCDEGCTEKEAAKRIKQSSDRGVSARAKNENWTRKNKDTLLFERLVKKWCK